jgi:hypothetical protein
MNLVNPSRTLAASLFAVGLLFGSNSFAHAQSDQKPADQKQPDNGAQASGNSKAAVVKKEAERGSLTPGAQHKLEQGADEPKPSVVLAPGQVPLVVFDTPTFDAGRIKSGQEIIHDYWFTNKGNGPLEIIDVRPSCGCTTAGGHDRVVQPGKTGKIPIRVVTLGMSGPLAKIISVLTNAPANGSNVVLTVKADIWHPVEVSPPAASFGRLTSDMTDAGAYERRLTITNHVPGAVANLTDIKTQNPRFSTELVVLEPGQKFELIVRLKQPLDFGSLLGAIELNTGVSEQPHLSISAQAYVASDVDVTPNKISAPIDTRIPISRQLYVRNNTTKPVTISDLTASNPQLKVSMKETQPGIAYLVTVDIPSKYTAASGGDRVTIKTSNPRVPELIVPVVNYDAAVEKANRRTLMTSSPMTKHAIKKPLDDQAEAKPAAAAKKVTPAPVGAATKP